MKITQDEVKQGRGGCVVLALVAIGLLFVASQCDGGGPEIADPADPAALAKWQADVRNAASACDAVLPTLTEAIAKGEASDVEAYRLASIAEAGCDESMDKVRAIAAPAMPEAAAKLGERAMETCRNAFASRALVADRAGKIIDGDMKPSMIAEFGDFAGSARVGMPQCEREVAATVKAATAP